MGQDEVSELWISAPETTRWSFSSPLENSFQEDSPALMQLSIPIGPNTDSRSLTDMWLQAAPLGQKVSVDLYKSPQARHQIKVKGGELALQP